MSYDDHSLSSYLRIICEGEPLPAAVCFSLVSVYSHMYDNLKLNDCEHSFL